MRINVGTLDRTVRLFLGLLLIAAPFAADWGFWANPGWTWVSVALGAVLVVTGIVRSCPAYTLFRLSTCKVRVR